MATNTRRWRMACVAAGGHRRNQLGMSLRQRSECLQQRRVHRSRHAECRQDEDVARGLVFITPPDPRPAQGPRLA